MFPIYLALRSEFLRLVGAIDANSHGIFLVILDLWGSFCYSSLSHFSAEDDLELIKSGVGSFHCILPFGHFIEACEMCCLILLLPSHHYRDLLKKIFYIIFSGILVLNPLQDNLEYDVLHSEVQQYHSYSNTSLAKA